MKDKVEIVLDDLFSEHFGKNKLLFKKYQKLYNLPITKTTCVVSKTLFDYCLRKKYFIMLLLYDENGKVFMSRVMSDILEWGLPGGSIKNDETINEAINRIAKEINENIIIDNIEPISMIENNYKYLNSEYIHYGLGFIARVRKTKNKVDIKKLTGNFISITPEEYKFVNRKASKIMLQKFEERYKDIIDKTHDCFQENEIITNELYKKRYLFHEKIVKKYTLTNKRKKKREFENIIFEKIIGSKSLIDISCGDDNFLFNLAKKLDCELIVGNDISWSQINSTNKEYMDVIFTNHNAAALPFAENKFDVAYCSNTLHHMQNKESLINLLNSAFNISKKIIIVEIENPAITGGFPKFLNKFWYIKYLKDVGASYLDYDQFKILIEDTFSKKATIKISKFRNIMGTYMMAEIIKED